MMSLIYSYRLALETFLLLSTPAFLFVDVATRTLASCLFGGYRIFLLDLPRSSNTESALYVNLSEEACDFHPTTTGENCESGT